MSASIFFQIFLEAPDSHPHPPLLQLCPPTEVAIFLPPLRCSPHEVVM